jgi:hypothetical protein
MGGLWTVLKRVVEMKPEDIDVVEMKPEEDPKENLREGIDNLEEKLSECVAANDIMEVRQQLVLDKMQALTDLLHSMKEQRKHSPEKAEEAEPEESLNEGLDKLEKMIGEEFDSLHEQFCCMENEVQSRMDRVDDQQQLILEALQRLLECIEGMSSEDGRPYHCAGGEPPRELSEPPTPEKPEPRETEPEPSRRRRRRKEKENC